MSDHMDITFDEIVKKEKFRLICNRVDCFGKGCRFWINELEDMARTRTRPKGDCFFGFLDRMITKVPQENGEPNKIPQRKEPRREETKPESWLAHVEVD